MARRTFSGYRIVIVQYNGLRSFSMSKYENRWPRVASDVDVPGKACDSISAMNSWIRQIELAPFLSSERKMKKEETIQLLHTNI
jgi:hypothetical protein